MKLINGILKLLSYLLLVPILYIIISLIFSAITIDRKIEDHQVSDKTIYLSTNGIHLEIVIPKNDIDSLLLHGLNQETSDNYLSFGWGDENFYLNTPTWGDLNFNNALKALFFSKAALIHVTRYKSKHDNWVEIKISETELEQLNAYLQNEFRTNKNGMKVILENQGYSSVDDFYKAKGSFSYLRTCNTWVNSGFKQSGLEACLWTPFDFGLLRIYD